MKITAEAYSNEKIVMECMEFDTIAEAHTELIATCEASNMGTIEGTITKWHDDETFDYVTAFARTPRAEGSKDKIMLLQVVVNLLLDTTQRLELRTNDAYDTVLHVKGGGVVGAWTVDHGPECPLKHMLADNSPENWDDGPLMAGEPTDPDAYGELVYSVCDEGLWTVPDKKRLIDRLTFHLGKGSAIVAALDVDA